MKYIIAFLLSLGIFANAGATEIKSVGGPDGQCSCPVNKDDQNARPRKYQLKSFQDNRRNYKMYDNARKSQTINGDQCFNGGFRGNGY